MKTIPINTIKFGTCSVDQLNIVPKYIEEIKLENYPFPLNDSIATLQEINNLVNYGVFSLPYDYQSEIVLDAMFLEEIINYFKTELDLDYSEIANQINDDICQVVYFLKNHYNRPRPNQLAAILGIDFHPKKTTIETASYPSGKALISYCVLDTIAKQNPKISEHCNHLHFIIKESRLKLGLNYKSDIYAADEFGFIICSNNDFRKKYVK